MKYVFFLIFFALLYSPTHCGLCGINPPEDRSYCGNYLELNRTHRCAYCQEISTGKHYCLVRYKNQTIPGFECESSDFIVVNEDLPGAPCLNHKEIKKKDPEEITKEYCHEHSTDAKHPCCYFDDGINKKCFSIGKITSTTLYTYNDFLDCSMKYVKLNAFKFFVFLILFIF